MSVFLYKISISSWKFWHTEKKKKLNHNFFPFFFFLKETEETREWTSLWKRRWEPTLELSMLTSDMLIRHTGTCAMRSNKKCVGVCWCVCVTTRGWSDRGGKGVKKTCFVFEGGTKKGEGKIKMEETRNVGEELKGGSGSGGRGVTRNRRRARNETIPYFLLDVFYYFPMSYFSYFFFSKLIWSLPKTTLHPTYYHISHFSFREYLRVFFGVFLFFLLLWNFYYSTYPAKSAFVTPVLIP